MGKPEDGVKTINELTFLQYTILNAANNRFLISSTPLQGGYLAILLPYTLVI